MKHERIILEPGPEPPEGQPYQEDGPGKLLLEMYPERIAYANRLKFLPWKKFRLICKYGFYISAIGAILVWIYILGAEAERIFAYFQNLQIF